MAKKENVKEPSKKGTRGMLEEKIEMPSGIEVNLENGIITLRGPKGESSKNLFDPKVSLRVEGNSIVIRAPRSTKRDKTRVYTFLAHLKNMIRGVQEGYVYKLKVCSSHFPIKAGVSGSEFSVRNFLGERKARTMKIPAGVKVTVDASTITVEGADK